MHRAEEPNSPVKVKAVLVDPGPATVVWMNEAALQDAPDTGGDTVIGLPLDVAVPMAGMLGVPDALRAAAETGTPQHLQADLVSTARGSVAIVTSLYPVPGGNVLLLMEHAWQTGRRARKRSQ